MSRGDLRRRSPRAPLGGARGGGVPGSAGAGDGAGNVTFSKGRRHSGMRTERPMRVFDRQTRASLWALAITSLLLLSFVAALRADGETAKKTSTFSASGAIKSLDVEGISGDVVVKAGASFSATADVVVTAPTRGKAEELLAGTKVHFENENGELALYSELPGTTTRRSSRGWSWSHPAGLGGGFAIEIRYAITLPPAASLVVSTVNGTVRCEEIAGDLELHSVNGRVVFTGARGDVKAGAVNGSVDGSFAALGKNATVEVENVNGSVVLRVPAASAITLSARTLSGDVVSTLPFPVRPREGGSDREEARARDEMNRAKDRMKAERDRLTRELKEKERDADRDDGETSREVRRALAEAARELESSMAELSRDLASLSRDLAVSIASSIDRSYEGSVGGGGAKVSIRTVNGKIALLAEGTLPSAAKSLLPARRGRTYTVPPVPPVAPEPPDAIAVAPHPAPHPAPRAPRAPRPPRAPSAPAPPAPPAWDPDDEQGSVVRGDVNGDVFSSTPFGDVTLGKVSGHVKVTTGSGQIRLVEAGKGAELASGGGDVRVERVSGELVVKTGGGDVFVGHAGAEARLETSGGDIRVERAGGPVTARTSGGDVSIEQAQGALRVDTGGGSILCGVAAKELAGPSSLRTSGGDVTVTLPANFKGDVDVSVTGVDPDGEYVISDFSEIEIARRATHRTGTVSAEGKLGGGGAPMKIRNSSGTVTIRKGPPA